MRLAITRDSNQLTALLSEAESRRITLLPLPLTTIEPVAFTWPLPGNPRVDWLVFTSAHGVRLFFSHLDASGYRLNDGIKIAVVGSKTAAAVFSIGHDVAFVPSASYGDTLFQELRERHLRDGDRVIYVRAADVMTDPADDMRLSKVNYHEIICYRSVPAKSDKRVIDALETNDRILFTAPSKVAVYHENYGEPLARAIAIGNSTAGEMKRLGWHNFAVLSSADISTVWEQL